MSQEMEPTVTTNKLAMSRALGAAFLNHQVEQLEKTVSNTSTGNWRDRRQAPTTSQHPRGVINLGPKRMPSQAKHESSPPKKKGFSPASYSQPRDVQQLRRNEKDADVIVVDASVLVNALQQIKVWCRGDRKEVLIIPLEALNTLDLLKKGTSQIAQRARAASRILEAQVGTNSRILVQRDEDFVLWDKITFQDIPTGVTTDPSILPAQITNPNSTPEWVRRMICCAKFEADKATASSTSDVPTPKVVLAILSSNPKGSLHHSRAADNVPKSSSESPVPLPPPQTHSNKYEPRSSGTLVSIWAARAGVECLEIAPTPLTHSPNGRTSDEEERTRRSPTHGHTGSTRRKPSYTNNAPSGANGRGGALVERPPAVKAMMEMVSQPSKVVRVLARGEKLDPDP